MSIPSLRGVIAFVCLMLACASARAETRVLIAAKDLAGLGIEVKPVQLSTPMASVEVDVAVDPDSAPGRYEFTECVVLVGRLSESQLAKSDAGTSGVARRSKSTKVRSIFLIRGREVANAYLAFQFSDQNGKSAEVRRYLLPIVNLQRE